MAASGAVAYGRKRNFIFIRSTTHRKMLENLEMENTRGDSTVLLQRLHGGVIPKIRQRMAFSWHQKLGDSRFELVNLEGRRWMRHRKNKTQNHSPS